MQPFKLVAQPVIYKGLLGAFNVLYTDVFCILSVIETTFKLLGRKKRLGEQRHSVL